MFDANIIGAKEVAKLLSGAVKVTDTWYAKKGGHAGALREFCSLKPKYTPLTTVQTAQVIIDN